MKKNFFVAALTIAMAAVTLTSCKDAKKNEVATPVGEKIGQLTVVKKDNGRFTIYDKDNFDMNVDYTEVVDMKGFIAAYEGSSKAVLLNNLGGEFCHCDAFTVKPQYPVKVGETTAMYISASVLGGNVALDFAKHNSLCPIEGRKAEVYPLTNGGVIYKKLAGQNDGYGIAKQGETEPFMGEECTEVVVISTPTAVYYLIKTPDWAGYLDDTGKDIKALTPAQFNTAKKAGKELWSEGKVSARTVAKI